jgi:hypothetical protein
MQQHASSAMQYAHDASVLLQPSPKPSPQPTTVTAAKPAAKVCNALDALDAICSPFQLWS